MARLRSLKAKKEELIQTLDKSYTFWNCLKESVDESDRALLIMTAEISELTDIKNQVSKHRHYDSIYNTDTSNPGKN